MEPLKPILLKYCKSNNNLQSIIDLNNKYNFSKTIKFDCIIRSLHLKSFKIVDYFINNDNEMINYLLHNKYILFEFFHASKQFYFNAFINLFKINSKFCYYLFEFNIEQLEFILHCYTCDCQFNNCNCLVTNIINRQLTIYYAPYNVNYFKLQESFDNRIKISSNLYSLE